MKLFRRRSAAIWALACLAAVVVPVSALASGLARPKLTYTLVNQDPKNEMLLYVEFKIPKADTTSPARAKLCAVGRCKTEVLSKTGDSAPTAGVEYTPNVLVKADELGKRVTVTTTLTIGSDHWSYTSSAKDTKNPCVAVRHAAPGVVYHC